MSAPVVTGSVDYDLGPALLVYGSEGIFVDADVVPSV